MTEEIQNMMLELRKDPPSTLGGSKVIRIEDFQEGIAKDLLTGEMEYLEIPKSNVLIFYTEKGAKVAARPSGTEPKIKFYFSVTSEDQSDLDIQIEAIKKDLNLA